MKLTPESFRAHTKHEGLRSFQLEAGVNKMDLALRYIDVIRGAPRPSGMPMIYTCMCSRDKEFTVWKFAFATNEDTDAVDDALKNFKTKSDSDTMQEIATAQAAYEDLDTLVARAVLELGGCVCPFNGK